MGFVIAFFATFLIGYWLLTHHYEVVDKTWDRQNCEYRKTYGKVDAKVWHLILLLLISSIPIFGSMMVASIAFGLCFIENDRFYIINPDDKKKPSFIDKLLKKVADFFNRKI